MSKWATLLEPVWGLSREKVKPLIEAAESEDRSRIGAAIQSLEEMLANTSEDQFPYYAKYRAFEAEVKAKVAVLKAIASGEKSAWEAAHAAYQELKSSLYGLAASCCSCEDIAQIMFRANAEHAGKLAALCLEQIEEKRAEAAKQLLRERAKLLIDRVGPMLGCDYTDEPVFPETRHDVCAVRRVSANGSTYGYDTIYLVWRDKHGQIQYRELANSRSSKDYIHIRNVGEIGDKIVVEVESNGSYSGSPWRKAIRIPRSKLTDLA